MSSDPTNREGVFKKARPFAFGLLLLAALAIYVSSNKAGSKLPAAQNPIKRIDGDASFAQQEAEKHFFQHYLQQGDSYLAKSVPDKKEFAQGVVYQSVLFFECKKVNVTVDNKVLNEADKLNGIQWSGIVQFETNLWRFFCPVRAYGPIIGSRLEQGWNPWRQENRRLAIYSLTKVNGRWELRTDRPPSMPLLDNKDAHYSWQKTAFVFPAAKPQADQIPK